MKHFSFLVAANIILAMTANAQNVGIGTTAPTEAKLVVTGGLEGSEAVFGKGKNGIAIESAPASINFNHFYDAVGRKLLSAGFTSQFAYNNSAGSLAYNTSSISGTGGAIVGVGRNLLTITKDGNMGLGTTNPGTKLTLKTEGEAWGLEHSSDEHTTVVRTFLSNEFGQIGTSSEHPFELRAGAGIGKLRLMPNGNVGIGATKPELGKLVVRGTIGAVAAMFGDNTTGVAIENNSPGVGFNSYYNGSRKAIAPGFGGLVGMDATTGRFYVFTAPASVAAASASLPITERLTILPNGHVGIGINTPASMLDVNGRIRIRQTGITAGIGFDGKDASNNPQIDRGFVGMANNDYVGFYGSGGAGWGMAMNVSTGNVGIGIATPGAKLDIRSASTETGMYVGKSGTGTGMHVNSTTASPALYATNTNGPAFSTEGKVGVNVPYPNSTLQVGGSVSMPIKMITENYTATANDYSIRYVTTETVADPRTVTLPPAVGCAGRIYIISASIPFTTNWFTTRLYINNSSGANILASTIYSETPYLCHFRSAAGGTAKRQLSITIQSIGTGWEIISDSFFASP